MDKLLQQSFNELGERFVEIRETIEESQKPETFIAPNQNYNKPSPNLKLELDDFDIQLLDKIKQLEIQENQENNKNNKEIEIYSSEESDLDFDIKNHVAIKKQRIPKCFENAKKPQNVTNITSKKTVNFSKHVTEIVETKDFEDRVVSVQKNEISLSEIKQKELNNPVKENVTERVYDQDSLETNGASKIKESLKKNPIQEKVVEREYPESSCESDSDSDSENDVELELLGKQISLEYYRKTKHFIDAGILKRPSECEQSYQ